MDQMAQHFCFKWNNYQANLSEVFQNMLLNENMVDVTIACEGASIKAHKMVLAACSPFFHNLFMSNPCKHPIVILKDIRFVDLKATIEFMYKGEVNVSQDQLSALLKTADTLKVKGLSDITEKQARGQNQPQQIVLSKSKKRKKTRKSPSKEGGSDSSDSEDEKTSGKINSKDKGIDIHEPEGEIQDSITQMVVARSLEPSKILEQSLATAEVEGAPDDVVIAQDIHVLPNDEAIKQVALFQESIDISQANTLLALPGPSMTLVRPPDLRDRVSRKNDPIWEHWTQMDNEGDSKKTKVRCIYCKDHLQLKNATKCRKHTVKCFQSPLHVKKRFGFRKKMIVTITD